MTKPPVVPAQAGTQNPADKGRRVPVRPGTAAVACAANSS